MMIKGHPCTQDCPRRSGTCQATCKDLAEFEARRHAKNEARDAERRKHNLVADYISGVIAAEKRRRKRSK